MPRRILQERRVRAIAAVHALIGAAVIVGAIAWLAASSHAHGLAAVAIPFIAGVEVIVGALFTLLACLLWIYHPTGKWITAVLSAGATACSILILVLMTARVIEDWRGGYTPYVFLDNRLPILIMILAVAWSVLVLVALFRPDSREIFSTEYRQSIKADPATRIPFYSSPYFVIGVAVWLIIGWATSVLA